MNGEDRGRILFFLPVLVGAGDSQEKKKKDLAIPMEIYKQGVSVMVLCVYVFFGEGDHQSS